MGVHTVEALLRAGFRVSVLNRGKTASPFSERPEVSHIVADRFAERARVKRAITALGPWYAIVDFVAFAAVHARDVVLSCLLCASRPRYVYVSSDSVFMACERGAVDAARADGEGLREGDAVREASRAGVAACRRRDAYQFRYGSGKLEVEEELAAWAKRGFESTSLRLPDVFGPRDNLGGFLDLYEAVARASVGCHVAGVPDGAAHRASLAFAPDVASCIVALLRNKDAAPRVLHVACREAPTVAELVALVAEARGLERPPKLDRTRRAPLLSVDIGPLNVDAAQSALDWRPTALADAVRATCDWYAATPDNVAYTRGLADAT